MGDQPYTKSLVPLLLHKPWSLSTFSHCFAGQHHFYKEVTSVCHIKYFCNIINYDST